MKGGVFGCVLYLIGENVKLAVASSEGGGVQRELSQTPTWAVAAVCTFFIAVSVFLEKVLHKLGMVLWERHKKALLEALEKVKSELMIVGFISLLLTFGQSYILRICIPASAGVTMLPCPVEKLKDHKTEDNHRKLLWLNHRILAGGETSSRKCGDGYEPLISSNGLHQLHILIFFLAVFHVIYSFVTMMLGRLKIRGWKQWEQETQSHDYEFSNDPSRFRLTHETSFVRAHTRFWTRLPFFFYVGCFFRQFSRSVGKVDYLTLRNGFISVHLAPGSKFNFQKYIKRSLEDDFKVVVGVSPVLWTSFVVFLLLNVDGWKTLLWASLLPVIIILLVGTKLQAILTNMALEISERHSVVQGMPLVQGSDKYFWFGHPQLLLHLIHFALFQNAFQITYVFWIWYSFGLKSCFHADLGLAIVKVSIGVGVLCLCSYITLPLYALVTQMGSRMKKSIFDEQTSRALKKWRMTVKKKLRKPGKLPTMRLGDRSTSPTASSTIHSSGPSLHRYKTTGHSTRSSAYNDLDASDLEAEFSSPSPSSHNLFIRVDDPDNQETEILKPRREGETSSEDEFSFANSAPGVVQP